MGKYVLKNAAGGQFMFNLLAGNNQVILTSETYTSKAAARTGIASVQKNCQIDARYERRQSVRNEPYFVLKAAQGEIIGSLSCKGGGRRAPPRRTGPSRAGSAAAGTSGRQRSPRTVSPTARRSPIPGSNRRC